MNDLYEHRMNIMLLCLYAVHDLLVVEGRLHKWSSFLYRSENMSSVLYRSLCRIGDRTVLPLLPARFKPLWDGPVGPKTVFFWAPTIKWVSLMP